jgi:outer membrane protein W
MRFPRSLVAAGLGALALLAPRAAQAQADRAFENSWFWGVKGGVMQFWTSDVSHAPAGTGGLDMLITRRNTALNLSYEYAFFDETGLYNEFGPNGAPLGTQGRARINDMRRFTTSLMAFPKRYGMLRPYVGIGFSMNIIQRTSILESNDEADTQASLDDVRTRVAPLFTAGLQGQYRRVSLFGQAALMPAKNRFIFSNAETIFVEGGIRYNIGSSRVGTR